MPGIGKIFSYTGKTPKGILQAIVARGTPIPPDAFADGRRLLNLAFTQHEDELTKTLVKQYAQPLVNRLKRGSYQDMAQKAVNGVLAQSGGGGALGQLRAFNTATLLGRAVMVNATQGTVSAITAGLKPLLQTIKDVGSRQGREEMQNFALRIGESLDGAITDYLRHDLAPGKLQRLGTGVLRRTGFLLTERFNRRFAAAMGRHWFYDLQTKAKLGDVIALRQLKRFGVDPTRAMRGKLTQKDLYDFAQNFVTDTQIRLTPEELPLAANDPASPILSEWWRTVAQFKTFPLKVTELMLRDIETRGAKGIATGAVPGAIAATIGVGVPTAIARRVTAGRAPISKNETWYGLPLEAALSIGSAGLLLDSLEAFERGHELEYIAGPSGGVVQDVGRIVRDIGQGDIRGAVGTAMRRVPTFGPAISKGFMAATKPTPPRRRRRERE